MQHHIYHHNDMDGHASGAIIAYGLMNLKAIHPKDIFFYRINYGQPFNDSDIIYGEDKIYIVDFAFQPYERMTELAKKTSVLWIDHHKTSVDWFNQMYTDLDNPFDIVILEEGKLAACELCWEWMCDSPTPELIQRISQYDIWNKKHPDFDWEEEQIPLQMYLRNIETRPEYSMSWWIDQFQNDSSTNIEQMIKEGQILQDFNDKQLRGLTLGHGFEANLCGYKVFALNTSQGGSRQFEVAIDIDSYDMVCAFRLYKGEYWIVNLYSTNENRDCGALAKKLGAEGPCGTGGGHPGAAGFQTSYDHLFSLLTPIKN